MQWTLLKYEARAPRAEDPELFMEARGRINLIHCSQQEHDNVVNQEKILTQNWSFPLTWAKFKISEIVKTIMEENKLTCFSFT